MNGEIVEITKTWNDKTFVYEYQITIIVKEKPTLKVGDCVIEQKQK